MIQQPVDVHGTAGHGKAHTERDVLKHRGTVDSTLLQCQQNFEFNNKAISKQNCTQNLGNVKTTLHSTLRQFQCNFAFNN